MCRNIFKEEHIPRLQTPRENTSVYELYQTAILYEESWIGTIRSIHRCSPFDHVHLYRCPAMWHWVLDIYLQSECVGFDRFIDVLLWTWRRPLCKVFRCMYYLQVYLHFILNCDAMSYTRYNCTYKGTSYNFFPMKLYSVFYFHILLLWNLLQHSLLMIMLYLVIQSQTCSSRWSCSLWLKLIVLISIGTVLWQVVFGFDLTCPAFTKCRSTFHFPCHEDRFSKLKDIPVYWRSDQYEAATILFTSDQLLVHLHWTATELATSSYHLRLRS